MDGLLWIKYHLWFLAISVQKVKSFYIECMIHHPSGQVKSKTKYSFSLVSFFFSKSITLSAKDLVAPITIRKEIFCLVTNPSISFQARENPRLHTWPKVPRNSTLKATATFEMYRSIMSSSLHKIKPSNIHWID